MADHAARGKKALAESNFDEAIQAYTAALKASPTSPDYLIQRSTAYQRARKYSEALADANSAVLNAQKRAKRESIIEAQFRRGCAYYMLERYGDAAFVFAVVKRMDEKHKLIAMWENKVSMSVQKLELDDSKRKCTVKEAPEVEEPSPSSTEGSSTAVNNGGVANTSASFTLPSAPQQTAVDKIRHEWYQNSENVYFTLLVKGVPKDKAQIDIQERSLSISFPLATGASYDFSLDPLFDAIKPDKCIPRILGTKIEIVLAKATPGVKWGALESNEPLSPPNTADQTMSDSNDQTVHRAIFTESKPTGPAYPTSSKSGPKDWDKITRDLRAKDASADDENKTVDDDDYEGGDEANHFFKKLFKGASPETQRAMMKSYTESNGTALSTNWEEVKKAPVETLPPDGMEAKKW